MKKITLNLVKGLLAIVLFASVSVVLSPAAHAANGRFGQAPAGQSGKQLTASQVSQHLVSQGYEVINVYLIGNSGKWRAVVIDRNGSTQQIIVDNIEKDNSGSNSILAGQDSPL